MVDTLQRTESQSSSVFSDGTNSNVDDDLILSDASESEEEVESESFVALREESILESDRTVEDVELPETEDNMGDNEADDEQTSESLDVNTQTMKKLTLNS